MVIDISQYKDVAVDASQQIVAVRGGVLMKELQIALDEHGQFTSKINAFAIPLIY